MGYLIEGAPLIIHLLTKLISNDNKFGILFHFPYRYHSLFSFLFSIRYMPEISPARENIILRVALEIPLVSIRCLPSSSLLFRRCLPLANLLAAVLGRKLRLVFSFFTDDVSGINLSRNSFEKRRCIEDMMISVHHRYS